MTFDQDAWQKRIGELAQGVSGMDRDSPEFVAKCRKLTVLCWAFLSQGERHKFLSMTDPVTLEFDLTPMSIGTILRSWDVVMEFPPLAGWDKKFAKMIDGRRKKGWMTPSEEQEFQIRRIFDDAMRKAEHFRASADRQPEVQE